MLAPSAPSGALVVHSGDAATRRKTIGQIGPIVQRRWSRGDDRVAVTSAEAGSLQLWGELCEEMAAHYAVRGALGQIVDGILGKPIVWEEKGPIVELLAGTSTPGTGAFWQMCPSTELHKMLTQGLMAGVCPAERWDDEGVYRLHALDPRGLRWTISEGKVRWTYQGYASVRDFVPGNGRDILFAPYGEDRPWAHGLGRTVAGPWLALETTTENSLNFQDRHATGWPYLQVDDTVSSVEIDRVSRAMEHVEGWVGAVFPRGMSPGILQTAGQGHQIYSADRNALERAIIIGITGQLQTTFGTEGFDSGEVGERIKDDAAATIADALSEVIVKQHIGPWALEAYGDADLAPWFKWQIVRPRTMLEIAQAIAEQVNAANAINAALAASGAQERVDIVAMVNEAGLPLKKVGNEPH